MLELAIIGKIDNDITGKSKNTSANNGFAKLGLKSQLKHLYILSTFVLG